MAKMLNVLVSNSQLFLLKKCEQLLQIIFFFSNNISVYAIFNDQSFNDALTNDIVSFEQLGPGIFPHLFPCGIYVYSMEPRKCS